MFFHFLFPVLFSANFVEGTDSPKIEIKDKWDLSAIYKSQQAVEETIAEFEAFHASEWSFLNDYQAHLHDKRKLLEFLKAYENTMRNLEKLFVYSHLKYDENLGDDAGKELMQKTRYLHMSFSSALSWFEPGLLAQDESYLQEIAQDKDFADYHVMFEKLLHQKKHVLSAREEQLFSMSDLARSVSENAFQVMNNVDFQFEDIQDSKGKVYPVTHALFNQHLQSSDRTLRENAFSSVYDRYVSFGQTLSELLHGHVQNHVFEAKARSFSSCLERALFPNKIDTEVYHQLLHVVHESLPSLHEYMALKKKILGVEELKPWDLYAPLSKETNFHVSYDEAVRLICDALTPVDTDYLETMKEGLTTSRWVDRYESKGKRSGAYSSGCYDTYPYILMNFHGSLRDVLTLSHEAGHSMHSYLARQHQNYMNAEYSIFVAEIASTFHEALTYAFLIEKARSKQERIFLLTGKLEDLRATFYRQSMFAEFELWIHQVAEKGGNLSLETMKKKYRELNQQYFGEDLSYDERLSYEFLRIPHFYSNFYVYQYATGVSASEWIYQKVQEDPTFFKKYRAFLESGGSKFPLDQLKMLGLDMRTKQPYQSLVKQFNHYLEMLKKEIG